MNGDLITIEFTPLTDYRKIGQELYETGETWKQDLGNFILKWVDSSDSILVHTSGSTGDPKGIRISKNEMRNSAKMTGEFFQLEARQTALLCLSTNYIAGKMMVVRAIIHQMTLVAVEPTSTPLQQLTTAADFAAMVPLQIYKTLQLPNGLEQLNHLKQLIIGGGALDSKLSTQLNKLDNKVYATYGMTETISHIALRVVNGSDASDWFTVLPGITIEGDERNCLVINAPKLATETLITNDIAEFSGSNQFRILGRIDNVINTGGIKINPETVEEKLAPFIQQPFLISSVADEKLENKVVLVIEGTSTEIGHLEGLFKELLSVYETPKDILFVKEFVRTDSGKIKRNETQQLIPAR